jgi:hypothetical protein
VKAIITKREKKNIIYIYVCVYIYIHIPSEKEQNNLTIRRGRVAKLKRTLKRKTKQDTYTLSHQPIGNQQIESNEHCLHWGVCACYSGYSLSLPICTSFCDVFDYVSLAESRNWGIFTPFFFGILARQPEGVVHIGIA